MSQKSPDLTTEEKIVPRVIETHEELQTIIAEISKEPVIAVDTENDRHFRYKDEISLVQIATSIQSFIIDAHSITDLTTLSVIFSNPNIIKIFHDGRQDILDLKKQYKFSTLNTFDTFIAARLLELGTLGLAALVQHFFDINLSKKQQKADWAIRPLTPAMISYAATDVKYLIPIKHLLNELLVNKNLMENFLEYMGYIEHLEPPNQIFNPGSYRTINGASKLAERNQFVLYHLYIWREKVAEQKNKAPFLIISNSVLLQLATELPKTMDDLSRIPQLGERMREKYAESIISSINIGLKNPIPPNFNKLPKKRLIELDETSKGTRYHRKPYIVTLRLKNLLEWRDVQARAINLDADVFMPKHILEQLAELSISTLNELPSFPGFTSYRKKTYENQIFQILKNTIEDSNK